MKASSHPFFRSGLLAALAALSLLTTNAASMAAGTAAGDGWRLGVADVPAPQLPGAKVRTPVRIEVLAGQKGQGSAPLQAVSADQAVQQLVAGELDAWVGTMDVDAVLPAGVHRTVLQWSASPMAIMRTDTDIHEWSDLGGRTVCLSADGRVSGELSARYGAIEQVYASATDALLALRTGLCDVAVQDEAFLKQLLTYPEWRKFSAQLSPYRQQALVRLMRDDLPEPHKAAIRQASSDKRLRELVRQQAQDIAFEVYLDQTVPDCH